MHVLGNPHGEDGHFPHTSVGVGKGTVNSTVGGRGQDVLNEDYALGLALHHGATIPILTGEESEVRRSRATFMKL